MNLREIGILLVFLYVITVLLMTYKYYNAKGGVFQVSRLLVFKYFLRLISLMALLFLCYNVILSKQIAQKQLNNKPHYLIAISATPTSLTWNNLRDKIVEMPPNGDFGLIMYDQSHSHWFQLIPATNLDSFLNLLEHAQDTPIKLSKRVFKDPIPYKPMEDKFAILHISGNQWIQEDATSKDNTFLSKNAFMGWIKASYVPLYLVISLLVISFIDIIFPIKALKI